MSKTKDTKKAPTEQTSNPSTELRWNSEASIEITGVEFYHLNQIAQAFSPLVGVADAILKRMVKSGVAVPYDREAEALARESKEETEVVPKKAPDMSVV